MSDAGKADLDDLYSFLKSIDASLKVLVARQAPATAAPAQGQTVASDADLDGTWGNPEVKFNPRDWTGTTMKGRRFSECPVEFLEMLAETFDYFAGKAEESGEMTTGGKPVAPYKRKDAARARGWAARIRAGKVKPADPAAPTAWADEDSVPF